MTASPINRMVHLGGGWLAMSLAERHDAHQSRAARARHPDAVVLDRRVLTGLMVNDHFRIRVLGVQV
jgi:hypothetical protein